MTGKHCGQEILEIARLYYVEGKQQAEIAQIFDISRSQVSKLLKRGRDEGIIHLHLQDSDVPAKDIEQQLKSIFALQRVIIASDGSPDVKHADTGPRVGAKAAQFLADKLRDGLRIGIEWGTSLYYMVQHLRVQRTYDVEVFQMHGVIDSPYLDIEGFVLARRLAKILGGKARLIQAPMLVAGKELRDLLVSEKKIADSLAGARNVDIAFVGIGSNEQGDNELAKAGYLSREESLAVKEQGGSATLSGWFIGRDGRVMDHSVHDRFIGVHPESFKDIPQVAAVAYGKQKVNAIISALNGGYIDVLITDMSTALGIIAEVERSCRVRQIPADVLKTMYVRMLRTRLLDSRLEQLFAEKQMYGTTHLSIGQEASSVVPGCALEEQDLMFGTHRGHGHSIGKGLDSVSFMAELFGRKTGCAGGRGGSMHLVDASKGIMGMNGVVAGALPAAAGAALSSKMLDQDRCTAVFLGDGATNEGAFHEAMNLASVWKLPVIFLCENNLYGLSVHIDRSMNVENLASRAASYGMPGWTIDGNDAVEVYHGVERARSYAMSHGPVFLVMETYRISGHSKSDVNAYRDDEEIRYWKTQCPIERFRALLIREGLFSQEDLQSIDENLDQEVREAEQEARNAPVPDISELMENVYS